MATTPIIIPGFLNGKLMLTVEDPLRMVSSIPGTVKITNVQLSGLVKNSDLQRIRTALARPQTIKSQSTNGGLNKVFILTSLTEVDRNRFIDNFVSADLVRIGNSPSNTPPPPDETNGYDYYVPQASSASSFKLTPLHGAIGVALLLAFLYFRSK